MALPDEYVVPTNVRLVTDVSAGWCGESLTLVGENLGRIRQLRLRESGRSIEFVKVQLNDNRHNVAKPGAATNPGILHLIAPAIAGRSYQLDVDGTTWNFEGIAQAHIRRVDAAGLEPRVEHLSAVNDGVRLAGRLLHLTQAPALADLSAQRTLPCDGYVDDTESPTMKMVLTPKEKLRLRHPYRLKIGPQSFDIRLTVNDLCYRDRTGMRGLYHRFFQPS